MHVYGIQLTVLPVARICKHLDVCPKDEMPCIPVSIGANEYEWCLASCGAACAL